jgi:hypothetical protein
LWLLHIEASSQGVQMQHHSRRRSGLGSANTSMTDVRRAVMVSDLSSKSGNSKSSRPAPMTRRSTTKVSQKLGKSPRDRALEWEEERWWEEERETFPQYWYVLQPGSIISELPSVNFTARGSHGGGSRTRWILRSSNGRFAWSQLLGAAHRLLPVPDQLSSQAPPWKWPTLGHRGVHCRLFFASPSRSWHRCMG